MRCCSFAFLFLNVAYAQPIKITPKAGETINAHIYKPEGSGPFPAVIVLHDCGGYDPHVALWAGPCTDFAHGALSAFAALPLLRKIL